MGAAYQPINLLLPVEAGRELTRTYFKDLSIVSQWRIPRANLNVEEPGTVHRTRNRTLDRQVQLIKLTAWAMLIGIADTSDSTASVVVTTNMMKYMNRVDVDSLILGHSLQQQWHGAVPNRQHTCMQRQLCENANVSTNIYCQKTKIFSQPLKLKSAKTVLFYFCSMLGQFRYCSIYSGHSVYMHILDRWTGGYYSSPNSTFYILLVPLSLGKKLRGFSSVYQSWLFVKWREHDKAALKQERLSQLGLELSQSSARAQLELSACLDPLITKSPSLYCITPQHINVHRQQA